MSEEKKSLAEIKAQVAAWQISCLPVSTTINVLKDVKQAVLDLKISLI